MEKKIRVGIVDDHLFFRTSLRSILEHGNLCVVSEAENGLASIDMFDKHRPDVVLMDINMPIMNGLDATRIITSKFL